MKLTTLTAKKELKERFNKKAEIFNNMELLEVTVSTGRNQLNLNSLEFDYKESPENEELVYEMYDVDGWHGSDCTIKMYHAYIRYIDEKGEETSKFFDAYKIKDLVEEVKKF